MPALSTQHILAIRKLQASLALTMNLLMVIDRDSDADEQVRLVSLGRCIKPAQSKALAFFLANKWCYFLKCRRLGITTILAAWFFWRWLFTPNYRVAVIAHTLQAAESIFQIYKRFYDNLPDWLRAAFPCDTSNVREMRLFHGGLIKVYSARAESIRGDGYNALHCTEVAQWQNFEATVRSAFQATDGRPRVVLETTAHGTGQTYHLWHGTGTFKLAADFAKLFLGTLEDPDYRMEEVHPDYLPPPTDPEEREWELDYQASYGADDLQMNWLRWCLRRKCMGSVDTLMQEYPPVAEVAFLLSGKPYFSRRFEGGVDPFEGPFVVEGPVKFTPYVMGIDSGTGSPDGDYHAAVVCKLVRDGEARGAGWDAFRYEDVATLYIRHRDIVAFAADALDLASGYDAFVNPEPNGPGTTVVQHFKQAGYPNLFRRTVQAKVGKEQTERIGYSVTEHTRPFLLGRLQAVVNSGRFRPRCPRLQAEMNAFCYGKTGRPEAPPGMHDDLVFAAAHAVMAAEQAGDESYVRDKVLARRPQNPIEAIEWEAATGILLDEYRGAFGSDRSRLRIEPSLASIRSWDSRRS